MALEIILYLKPIPCNDVIKTYPSNWSFINLRMLFWVLSHGLVLFLYFYLSWLEFDSWNSSFHSLCVNLSLSPSFCMSILRGYQLSMNAFILSLAALTSLPSTRSTNLSSIFLLTTPSPFQHLHFLSSFLSLVSICLSVQKKRVSFFSFLHIKNCLTWSQIKTMIEQRCKA